MSTRAVIAYADGDEWVGSYHHWDGYPTWLGTRLWERLQTDYTGEVGQFIQEVITDHPGGWSSIETHCYCHPAEGTLTSMQQYTSMDDVLDNAALLIEWVYVFAERGRVLTVYASYPTGKTIDHVDGYEEPQYLWRPVGQFSLDGPMPDWKALEEHVGAEADGLCTTTQR